MYENGKKVILSTVVFFQEPKKMKSPRTAQKATTITIAITFP